MKRYIYIIGDDYAPIKVGIANDPEHRIKALQTGNAKELKIHHLIEVPYDNCHILEKIIHNHLRLHRMKGEWFNIDNKKALEEINFLLMHLDLDTDLRKYLPNGSLYQMIAKI